MTIKGKLLSLITVYILLFMSIIGVYFMIMAPIEKIEQEKELLLKLKDSIQTERIMINKVLGQTPYVRQIEDFYTQVGDTNLLFNQMDAMTYLKNSSDDIAEALEIIGRLNDMKMDRLTQFKKGDQEFRTSVEDVYIFLNSFSFVKIYQAQRFKDISDSQTAALFNLALTNFLSQHSIYENVLESSVTVIDEQFEQIEEDVAKIESRSLMYSLVGIVVIMFLMFLGSLVFTGQIVRNIHSIQGSIRRLKEGDLTTMGEVKSRDELRKLNDNLSQFQESTKGIIDRIKCVSDENLSVRDKLVSQVDETNTTSRTMAESAISMSEDIRKLDETSKISYEAVEVISGKIGNLNESILEQTSMIEESSAAVNEMMASIANVEQVTNVKLGSLENMVKSVDEGNGQLKDTSMTIQKINSSIDAIRNMIDVIEDISSQTNLLSMNAAIEAAHAGEYGKGFAVVSDEIRKLAEASSQNSREIGSSLNEIIENIREATESSDTTLNTFTKTVSDIEGLFNSMNEISQSMVELKSGGDQILSAMSALQTMAVDTRQDSSSMTVQSQNMIKAVEDVQSISGSVSVGITQLSSGVDNISAAIDKIQDMTGTIGSVAGRIGKELEFFQTQEACEDDELDQLLEDGGMRDGVVLHEGEEGQSDDIDTLDTAEMVVAPSEKDQF